VKRPLLVLVIFISHMIGYMGVAFSDPQAIVSPAHDPETRGGDAHLASVHDKVKSPVEMIRTIEILQDQIAAGKKPVEAAMPAVVNQIAERLITEDPEVWKDPKNVQALVIYLFSGGQPRVAKKVLGYEGLPSSDGKLLDAAYAYTIGNRAKAAKILRTTDPNTLPSFLGAHVALIKALLVAEKEPANAMRYLDLARILAPGTLIEEAALRREIFLAESSHRFSKFFFLSGQYTRRFRNSIYFDNFYKHFVNSIVGLSLNEGTELISRQEEILSALSLEQQAEIYLAIAYQNLLCGRIDQVAYALSRTHALGTKSAINSEREVIYQNIVDFLKTGEGESLDRIARLDEKNLSSKDTELAHALLQIGRVLQETDAEQTLSSDETFQPEASSARDHHVMELIKRTDEAMNSVDRALHGGAP